MSATTPVTDRRIARSRGIGGSDIAAAVGMSPWKTPLALYLEKTGELVPDDLSDNQRVHFGNVLEDVVASEFQRRTGKRVNRVNSTLVHPQHAFLLANIDRRIVGERAGLECKTADRFVSEQFGEEGTDEVPMPYLLQCAGYMAVTGYETWHLAVLIGGNDFRAYQIRRDMELEQTLIERLREFWARVQTRTPPDPRTLADAALLWPKDNGHLIVATPYIETRIAELKELKARARDVDRQIDAAVLDIQQFIGEHAEVVLSPDGKRLATWRAHEVARLDGKRLKSELPDVAAKYTTESLQRPLLLK